jgi:hypothetical protein
VTWQRVTQYLDPPTTWVVHGWKSELEVPTSRTLGRWNLSGPVAGPHEPPLDGALAIWFITPSGLNVLVSTFEERALRLVRMGVGFEGRLPTNAEMAEARAALRSVGDVRETALPDLPSARPMRELRAVIGSCA